MIYAPIKPTKGIDVSGNTLLGLKSPHLGKAITLIFPKFTQSSPSYITRGLIIVKNIAIDIHTNKKNTISFFDIFINNTSHMK